jgi:hypothetical protein
LKPAQEQLASSAFSTDLLEKLIAMPYCRAASALGTDIPMEIIAISCLGSPGGLFPSLYSTLIFIVCHILTLLNLS